MPNQRSKKFTSLPKNARLPINRCNVPARIIGSLEFQAQPLPLYIDSVAELYKDIFLRLARLANPVVRSKHFMAYLSAQFLFEQPSEMGLDENVKHDRSKATYLRLVRGWFFNADSIEGAVIKGWSESRFGLIPRYHRQPIRQPGDDAYTAYIQEWAQGIYNTNALESQLDLLYAYAQFELKTRYKEQETITLYRGCNKIDEYEVLGRRKDGSLDILINNINSFSATQERADEFGDYVLEVEVPISKIAFYTTLLPGILQGEDEYVVLGGLYNVRRV